MSAFMKAAATALGLFSIAAFAVSASAQDINVEDGSLGRYYQNLYLQTHWMAAAFGHYARPGQRTIRYTHAAPVWTLSPSHSAVITRMVANVPPSSRPQIRFALQKSLSLYPALARAASQGEGVTLHATSTPDTATLAGALSYEALTGHELTRAQLTAERNSTRQLFASGNVSSAQMQSSGEIYAMAVCLMAVLKEYEKNPQNKNPAKTHQQLHQLALKTFQVGYKSADYTKFAPTSKGIVKVSQ